MKKIGFIIFGAALITGVVIANFTSFGRGVIKSPLSFVFGSKITGSGTVISENRNTGEFEGVEVGGFLSVEIEQGDKYTVTVKGDDNIVPLITTEVRDGILAIGSENKFRTKNHVTVFVTAPSIKRVGTSGVSNVKIRKVDADLLKIYSSGASKIEASGNVDRLEIDMSGASRLRGRNLKARTAEIDGSGASSIVVDVTEALDADVSGASSVSYTGDVSDLKKSVSGAASVTRID